MSGGRGDQVRSVRAGRRQITSSNGRAIHPPSLGMAIKMSLTDIIVTHDVSDCQQYTLRMSRWNPNARGRLEQAALALYSSRGFEQTTVAEIAAQADLTERTFFRHFSDKREVLFGGAVALQVALVEAVAGAPPTLAPIDVVMQAFEVSEVFVFERREQAQQRQRILDANVELQERELMKLASLSTALAQALRSRGLPATAAGLTAGIGITVFMAAFNGWIDDANTQSFPQLIRQALGELRVVIAPTASDAAFSSM